MKKWLNIMVLVLGGILPVAVAIVSLQQFGIIGLDTSLLLGLLYLLFVSTHVWCRIFTKIPPSNPNEQVDALPCYEEAVKSEPPPYSSLYPGNTMPCDVTASTGTTLTSPVSSKPAFTSCHFIPTDSNTVILNPVPDETPDDLPILGKLYGDTRRNSRPVVVIPIQGSGTRPTPPSFPGSTDFPAASSESPGITPEGEEKRLKSDRIYSRMLSSIVSPTDVV